MPKPDILIVDGHPFSWQRICEVRHQQLEAWRAEQARQLALFELKGAIKSRPCSTVEYWPGAFSFPPSMKNSVC
jgi:hypothetical protein